MEIRATSNPTVTVVIPALNDRAELEQRLAAVLAVADQVVVSDGGSEDGTPDLCQRLGAVLVSGPAGRGRQLNRGAAAATGEILLFLHADTDLPPEAIPAVREAISNGYVGGGFKVRFNSPGLVYRLGERTVNLRSALFRNPLGDQTQFATQAAFSNLSGYHEWPILEDFDFIRRLKSQGPLAIIPYPVVTSARRFQQLGPARTVATNWLIWLLYAVGVPPQRLAGLYRNVR